MIDWFRCFRTIQINKNVMWISHIPFVWPFNLNTKTRNYSFSLLFSKQIKNYEKTECHDERRKLAREIYDNFIMKEMLSHTHVSEQEHIGGEQHNHLLLMKIGRVCTIFFGLIRFVMIDSANSIWNHRSGKKVFLFFTSWTVTEHQHLCVDNTITLLFI